MLKILQVWISLSVLIGLLIYGWNISSNKERWQLTKIVLVAILCGLIASVSLLIVYLLF
jgi:hypothetical protein